MKSERNKTIDFPVTSAGEYIKKCENAASLPQIVPDCVALGDSFELVKKIADKSVDLLIVDPPYNLEKDFHGGKFKKMNDEDYREYTEKWIKGVKPKLKDTASVYVCCDWKSSIVIGKVLSEHFILRNRITWEREKGRGAKSNWKNSMEDVYFCSVSDKYTFNLDAVKERKTVLAPYKKDGVPKDWKESEDGRYRLTCPSNFWDDISVPYWSMKENTAHPTQKPEKLLAKIMLASSNEEDVVLDIFAGSGTTGVVAKKLGRRYICIEKNPLYCGWAEYRLKLAEEDKTIQGYKDGVFYERNSHVK